MIECQYQNQLLLCKNEIFLHMVCILLHAIDQRGQIDIRPVWETQMRTGRVKLTAINGQNHVNKIQPGKN